MTGFPVKATVALLLEAVQRRADVVRALLPDDVVLLDDRSPTHPRVYVDFRDEPEDLIWGLTGVLRKLANSPDHGGEPARHLRSVS